MRKILSYIVIFCFFSTNIFAASNFTGFKCKFSYKTDYFDLGYINCAYRCDNYVNGVNTKMDNGNYAYYMNKKIWPGQTCPPGRDD